VNLPHFEHRLSIPLAAMVSGERTIKSSSMGSCSPRHDMPRFIERCRQGRLAVDRLRSGRIGLDDIHAGFDRLAAGEAIRQILHPHA